MISSLLRDRRISEARSGGKIVRRRREEASASASPYSRPLSPPLPPSSATRDPSWLSGFLSGAGKLISSVLFTPSNSSSSSVYSSEDDSISTSNEDEDIGANSKGDHEINQVHVGRILELNPVVASSAIVPVSKSKLAIQQLLMQETFSRDESKRLTEIIQSRVVDCPSAKFDAGKQKKISDIILRTSSFLGEYRSLDYNSRIQEAIPHSSNNLSDLSPGISVFRTPDLRATAVKEAKKWVEKKKMETCSTTNLDCGPCTLNTDMRQFDIEVGSPVDMAKSYMRSLPPWKSPSFQNTGFSTPPPSVMCPYKDETHYVSTISLPPTKDRKRDHLSTGLLDTLEENRRVRLKSTSNHREINQSTSLLDHTGFKISSVNTPRELHAEDHSTNGTISLSDETLDSLTIHYFGINHDLGEPPSTKETTVSFSVPHEPLVLAPSSMARGGDPLPESKDVPPGEIKSAAPSEYDDGTNPMNIPCPIKQSSAVIKEGLEVNGSPQLSFHEGSHPIADSSQSEGNAQIRDDAVGSTHKTTGNGVVAGSNTNLEAEPSNICRTPAESSNSTGQSQDGITMKSNERVLSEPQTLQKGTPRRGKKTVVRPKRGRGKTR